MTLSTEKVLRRTARVKLRLGKRSEVGLLVRIQAGRVDIQALKRGREQVRLLQGSERIRRRTYNFEVPDPGAVPVNIHG